MLPGTASEAPVVVPAVVLVVGALGIRDSVEGAALVVVEVLGEGLLRPNQYLMNPVGLNDRTDELGWDGRCESAPPSVRS